MHTTETILRQALRVMREQLHGKDADGNLIPVKCSDDLSLMITQALALPEVPETQLVSREPRNVLGTKYLVMSDDEVVVLDTPDEVEDHLNDGYNYAVEAPDVYKITGSVHVNLERSWKLV